MTTTWEPGTPLYPRPQRYTNEQWVKPIFQLLDDTEACDKDLCLMCRGFEWANSHKAMVVTFDRDEAAA